MGDPDGLSDVHSGDAETVPDRVSRQTRGVGVVRHVLSAVIAMFAVPVGYIAATEAHFWHFSERDATLMPDQVVVPTVIAAVCFLAATLSGLLSGLGPLMAGTVWGIVPTAWMLLNYAGFAEFVDLLRFVNVTWLGFLIVSPVVLPAVGSLLVGAGVAGRWRRPA